MKRIVALLALASLTLTACVGPHGPKAQLGGMAGAASGGLIAAAAGGPVEAISAGVLVGGLLGGAAGNLLDNADREYAYRTAQYGLEYTRTGTTTRWRNPDSGRSGTITPTDTWQTSSGRYCREFETTIDVDGWPEEAYGTACRQPDGSWEIQ